ncbi:MAG: biotin/lipoyl-containing protein [Filifactoraceae bacterium]
MIKKFNVTVNGKNYEVEVEEVSSTKQSADNRENIEKVISETKEPMKVERVYKVEERPAKKEENTKFGEKIITAPMPGTILDIKVSNGTEVKKGEVLLILEAMKMENEILAPEDGIVSSINVSKGSSVNTGDILATM